MPSGLPLILCDSERELAACASSRAFEIHEWFLENTGHPGVLEHVNQLLSAAKRTIVPDLRLWNIRNDLLSLLPVEIRLRCFSYLPPAALLLASTVCCSWKRLIYRCPRLWARLDLSTPPLLKPAQLLHVLELSYDHPLLVSAFVRSSFEARILDICLSPHMPRVRSLQIDHSPTCFGHHYAILNAPAPALQELSYYASETHPGSSLFDGHAPQLQVLRLCGQPFSFDSFPTFLSVTNLTLHRPGRYLRTLLPKLPNLRSLYVDESSDALDLPPLPLSHPLKLLTLKSYASGAGKALCDMGYMRLERLEVEGCCAEVITYALQRASSPALSLQITVTGRKISIGITPVIDSSEPAAGVFFSSETFPVSRLEAVFRSPATAGLFHAITVLSIPRDFSQSSGTIFSVDERFNAELHRVLFPSAPLPNLDTLTIVCGARACGSLLDSDILEQCGELQAPMLRRVEFKCDAGARDIEPICPLDLVGFLTGTLVIQRPCLPELYIDRAVGIVGLDDDEGDMLEVLGSFVGSLVIE